MDDSRLEKRVVSKVFWRLMPYLFLLYIIAFLDRVNVGFAALSMNKDLGFSNAVYGLGAGIFFIGYFTMEVPGNMLMVRTGAKFWISRILITWGLVSAGTAWVSTPTQFYIVRFLLGVAEASFFPGVVYYLSTWFRAKDQAKAVGIFMAALPICNIIGAPISTYILGYEWLGWAGWRWLFILEAAPAFIFGFVTYFYLTDKVSEAKWLTDEEKTWLSGTLEAEKAAKVAVKKVSMKEAFTEPNVVRLTLMYLPFVTGFYGVTMFLPILVKNLSASINNQMVGYLVMIPYFFAFIAMILVSHHSDRTNERRYHTIVCILVGALGLLGSEYWSSSVVSSMFFFTLAVVGTYAMFGPFWAIPPSFLTEGAAAVALALINCVGNLGGFFGPTIMGYLREATGTFSAGVLFLVGCLVLSCFLLMTVKATGKVIEAQKP